MALTKITESVIQRFSKWFNVNSTTGAVTSVVPDLINSNTTLYPSFACRAWVNFDGTTANNLTGTYSQSGTTVTVTINNHGLLSGHSVSVNATTGTAVNGVYTVTGVTDVNTFTYTAGTSLTTSGNITLLRRLIRGSGNVSSVMRNGTGDYTVNFTTAMPDANYAVLGNSMRSVIGSAIQFIVSIKNDTTYSNSVGTSLCRIFTSRTDNGILDDPLSISIGIFR